MMGFNFVRQVNGTSQSLTFELYDDSAVVIDDAIVSLPASKEIQFEYGYYGGVTSPRYKANITKYSTKFKGYGSVCTIEAVSSGVVKAATSTDNLYKKYTGSISNIVRQIAKEQKWEIGVIEPSQDYQFEHIRHGEDPIAFIKSFSNEAISAVTGKGDYKFYLSSRDNKDYVYFSTIDYSSKSDEILKELPKALSKSLDQYDIFIGKPSERVISFEPEYGEALNALLGAKSGRGSAVKPENNEPISTEIMSLAHQSDIASNPLFNTVTKVIAQNTYTFEQLVAKAKSNYDAANYLAYPATLTLVGDPSITPMSQISILVMTRAGLKHHSSGKYLVESVNDSIQNGTFTTTLNLKKNALPSSTQTNTGKPGQGEVNPANVDPTFAEKLKKYLGQPYVWGGASFSDGGFDCSGFTYAFLHDEFGANISRPMDDQLNNGEIINWGGDINNLKPGDLLFDGDFESDPVNQPHHVIMYVGGGNFVHAPHTGDVIRYTNLYFDPTRVVRYL